MCLRGRLFSICHSSRERKKNEKWKCSAEGKDAESASYVDANNMTNVHYYWQINV
jgi:hypothetical protein